MLDLLLALLIQDATAAPAPPPAVQEQTQPAAPTATTPAEDETPVIVQATNPEVVRCRRAEPGVGSIIGRRICSSPRQDRERMERDQQEMQNMQDRQIGVCVPSTRPGSCGGAGGN